MTKEEKAISRRKYLQLAGGAVAGLVVGGALGYVAKPTVTGTPMTVTATETVTGTASPPPVTTAATVSTMGFPKIGFFGPLTGDNAMDGTACKQGVEMAVGEINTAGGIGGAPIQLFAEDDATDPSQSISVAHKLIESDQVVAVVGGSYSGATRASAAVYQDKKIPVLVAYAIHPAITQVGDYIFRNMYVGQVQGAAIGHWAAAQGVKKIAMLTMDNDFGRSCSDGFRTQVQKEGATVVIEKVFPSGEKDFTPYLTAIKDTAPEGLFSSGYYEEASTTCRQGKALGIKVPIFLTDGVDVPQFIGVGGESVEGVMIPSAFSRDSTRPIVVNFMKNYMTRYGLEATISAAGGYDALRILAQVIGKVGTDSTKIRDGLTGVTNFEGVTGVTEKFSTGREVVKEVFILQVTGGKFKTIGSVTDPSIIYPPQ